VAKRYHTSKISSFNDIQKLETYGFRGEALGKFNQGKTYPSLWPGYQEYL
jgi:hypothetical protein